MASWFPKMTAKRIAALLVAGVIAIAAIAAVVNRPNLDVERVVAFVERAQANPWSPAIFIGLYILSCIIGPFVLFPIAGGILFGFWEGLLYNKIASNVGAYLAFLIARTVGHDAVQRRIGNRLKPFEQAIHDHSILGIIAIRIIGFPPFMLANYLAGLSTIRHRNFIVGSFLGMTFWTTVLTGFSGTLWKIFQEAGEAGIKKAIVHFTPAVIGIVVGLLVIGLLARRLKKKALPTYPPKA